MRNLKATRTLWLTLLFSTPIPACVVGDDPADIEAVDSEGCSWSTVHTFGSLQAYIDYEPAKACGAITGIPASRPVDGPSGTVHMQCCYRDELAL
jgi:hypothetical protein